MRFASAEGVSSLTWVIGELMLDKVRAYICNRGTSRSS